MRLFLTISFLLLTLAVNAQPKHTFDADCPDVHDPVMAQGEDGRYYIFSTGMGIGVMSSSDLKTWREEPGVFSVTIKGRDGKEHNIKGNTPLPAWTTDSVKGFHGHVWAPDISYHNGKWYLYYSCSTFGKNGSAIGLATNKTLDPSSPYFKWEDQGPVIVSHRNKDNWNAIDPNLSPQSPLPTSPRGGEVLNTTTNELFNRQSISENSSPRGGQEGATLSPSGESEGGSGSGSPAVLFFGSFWDGIQMLTLEDNLKDIKTPPTTIARRFEPLKNNAKFADPAAFNIEEGDSIEAGFNAIEAPFVIENDGWYYLFVSWDYCCQGKNSTYKTVYGRSRNLEGPYLDKEGKDMAMGGGTLLVGPDDKHFGVGHCSAYELNTPDGKKQWYFLSHAYIINKEGRAKLFLRPLSFDKDGWLMLGDSLTP